MNSYLYEEITIGMKEEFFYNITEEKMSAFLTLTGDKNPMHCDAGYAKNKGFEGRIVYGMLNASLFSTLAGMYLPGKNSFLHHVGVKFVKPVYIGSTVKVCGEVIEKNDKYRFITVKTSIYNQESIKVCRGKMDIGVLE